jgi:flagellar assembly protein FliH
MSELEPRSPAGLFGAGLFGAAGFGCTGFTPDPRFAVAGMARGSAHAEAAPPPNPLALAHATGFAEGEAAARAAAEAQAARAENARARLELTFARLDAGLTEQLRQRLTETVAALCEATLAPLALDHALLAERARRAVALFSRAEDERVIRLNPDDLEAVRPLLPAEWTFAPDPALAPGALRVETASGGAEDGPDQWRRAIAEALDPAVGK